MHITDHFKVLRLLKNKELNEIYISIFFRSFAFGLISIFTPLYLLIELKYPLVSVLLFELITYAVMGFFSPVSAKIASKLGLKHAMLISIPTHLIYFYMLYALKFGLHYSIPAITCGLGSSIFWVAFHSDFTKFSDSDKRDRSQETSIWIAINAVAATIAPIAGALLITKTGNFSYLFFVVIGIFSLAMIPLFFSKDTYEKSKFSYKQMFKQHHLNETTALAGAGSISIGQSILWPIFVFLILGTYLKLGGLASLTGLFVAIFAIFSGQLTKKLRRRVIIRIGSTVNSITWFVRIFLTSFFHLVFITIMELLSFTFTDVAFHSKAYERAKKTHQTLDYIAYRELCYNLGRIFLIILILIALYVLRMFLPETQVMHYGIIGAFILTGFAALFMQLY